MVESDRLRLRNTFGQDAASYDRYRPGYPDRLFADLVTMGVAGPGGRVLEIGCGTGQATGPLVRTGSQVTAIELSPAMAAVARRQLAPAGQVDVVTAAFEDWPLPAHPFDLVLSATAFHWIDPAVRIVKAAQALRHGGVLAVVSTHHVAGGSSGFFADSQACYARFDPSFTGEHTPPAADDVGADTTEYLRSGLFADVAVHRYESERRYSGTEFAGLLGTFSSTWAIPGRARAGFLACIAELIESHYGGQIVKPYLNQMIVATRGR